MRKPCYTVESAHLHYPGTPDCLTLAQARKELARTVKESTAKCRRSYRRCTKMGEIKKGVVEIRIGGRQGFHLWNHYSIRKF